MLDTGTGAESQAGDASLSNHDKPMAGKSQKASSKTTRAYIAEEIIVTATRRKETLQEVGVAITSINPDHFTDVGLSSLAEIIAYIPGINFIADGQPGVGNLNMRGVTQEGGSPIVGIYVDDIPFTSGTPYANGGLFLFDGVLGDLERIEGAECAHNFDNFGDDIVLHGAGLQPSYGKHHRAIHGIHAPPDDSISPRSGRCDDTHWA